MLSFTRFITEVNKTLDKSKLKSELKGFEKLLSKDGASKTTILRNLRQILKPYGAIVKQETNANIPSNQIYVSALFDPDEDEEGNPSIELILLFNPSDSKMSMSSDNIKETIDSIIKALMHEYIHRMQYQKRNYVSNRIFKTDNKEKKYYGNTDEIEAFANNIAYELLDFTKGSKQKAKSMLRNFESTSNMRLSNGNLLSPDFQNYVKFFGNSSPITKRLVKRIYHYIDQNGA
jgi:hypothetical protein